MKRAEQVKLSGEKQWQQTLPWTTQELPPPPHAFIGETGERINLSSIPAQPAKSWDNEESDSDEGVAGEVDINMDTGDGGYDKGHDSDSSAETESECTTEIYVPRLATNYQKKAQQSCTQRQSEVIPSVSNDNLNRATAKISTTVTSEDIATNIDSGISNETSNVHSHEGTVRQKRPMSVSSSSHYSSSYSCGSRGEIPAPTIGQNMKLDEVALFMKEAKVSRVVSFLSLAYCALLVIMGVMFPVFEMSGYLQKAFVYEGYYIYLYGVAMLFLVYVYINVIKNNRKQVRRQKKSQKLQKNGTLPSTGAGHHHTRCCDEVLPTVGSLFLRITVVLLCVGSILDNGLRFGIHLSDNCEGHLINTIQPVVQISFMFLEIYFVFANSKMRIRHYPILAKFGIMHLIATNISIWLLSVTKEVHYQLENSKRTFYTTELNQTGYLTGSQETYTRMIQNLDTNPTSIQNCTHSSIMVKMAFKAKPYTYPCTVQFFILVTCIMFVLWRRVDQDSDAQCSDCRAHTQITQRTSLRTIDCSNTSKGLISGKVTVLAAVSCIILFFIFTSQSYPHPSATANLIVHIYQMSMYLIMTVIVVVVILKIRLLDYNSCRYTLLEDILLAICTISLFVNDLVGIITGVLYMEHIKGLLVLATSVAEFIQSLLQMVAMVMGMRLCITEETNSSTKQGRECVTFMIVANISLWLISLFSHALSQGHEVSLIMFGNLSWTVIVENINPVVTFYHLFSASCFIDIWYHTYRLPTAPVAQV